jgi:hypothetical protein
MKELWLLFFLLGNNSEYQAGGASQWQKPEATTEAPPQGLVVSLPSKEACLRTALLLEDSFPSAITRCIRQE